MITGEDFTAVRWRRSSYCSGASSTCVEMVTDLSEVWVRDSKDLRGRILVLGVEEWRALVCGVRAGEFGC